MGIVNVTPDSFSDGGVNFRTEDAVGSAGGWSARRAIVDVGGESTRPTGSEGVSLEELRRVVPVLENLAGLPVSISLRRPRWPAGRSSSERRWSTTSPRSARIELAEVAAEADAYVCAVHAGRARTMQANPTYDDACRTSSASSRNECSGRRRLRDPGRIYIDPGIGFGKTVEHNFELIRRLGEIAALGRPVVVGFSRKSSLGRILGDPDARRSRPASRRRWPPTSVVRRSFACTT